MKKIIALILWVLVATLALKVCAQQTVRGTSPNGPSILQTDSNGNLLTAPGTPGVQNTPTATSTFTCNVCTGTPTPYNTPTFTNTPTPRYSAIGSFDYASATGVTLFFGGLCVNYAYEIVSSTTNSVAVTFATFPQIGPVVNNFSSGGHTQGVIAATSNGQYVSGVISSNVNLSGVCTGLLVRSVLTAPTITQTIVYTVIARGVPAPLSFRLIRKENYWVLYRMDEKMLGPENWKAVKVFTDPSNFKG